MSPDVGLLDRTRAGGRRLPLVGQCHTWLVRIRARPEWVGLLDEAERTRAGSLTVAQVRDTFVTSRGIQRLIGGAYLGRPAGEVAITRTCQHCGDGHGRPRFMNADMDYSVSHSGDWVLVAVVGHGLVGVDIEQVDRRRDVAGLTRVVMSPVEAAGPPPHGRIDAFYTAWTRKEAAMKLTGLGLAAAPNQLDVRGPLLVVGQVPRWPDVDVHLHPLPAPAGHVAALASSEPLHTIWPMAWPADRPRGGRDTSRQEQLSTGR